MSAQLKVHPSVAQNRRKVMLMALSQFLPRHHVVQAMAIWDMDFADQAKTSASAFSAAISSGILGAPSAETVNRELVRAVRALRAISRDAAQAGSLAERPPHEDPVATSTSTGLEEPGAAPTAAQRLAQEPARPPAEDESNESEDSQPAAQEPASAVVLDDHVVVFNAMVDHLIDSMDGEARTELRAHLEVTIARVGLSPDGLSTLRPWCVSIDRDLHPVEVPITLDDARIAMHQLYVWLCEYDGPVTIDRLFGQAIRAASRLPEAADFSPRRLM